jgi:hypothetical protein
MTRDIRTFNGFMDLKTSLYFLSAIILAVALSLVIVVYHAMQNQSDSALGHEESTGILHTVMPEGSKRYLATFERYGERPTCSQATSVLASSPCDVGDFSSRP